MVRIPSSEQARNTRMAISPRLAHSTRRNGSDVMGRRSVPTERAKSIGKAFYLARSRRGSRTASAGAELEVALAYDDGLTAVDQEGPALTDHAVVGHQVPDVDAPAGVSALAGRRPLGRLAVALAGGPKRGLRLDFMERRRGAHDGDRALGGSRIDLAPPLADQT